MILTYIFVAVVTILLVRYWRKWVKARKLYHDLPGLPDFRWLTGTIHLFPGNNEEGLAFDLENAQKFCYFHRGWAGPFIPFVLLYHPETVRPILKSQAPKPRGTILSTSYDMGLKWLGKGLLIANGNKWARSRRLLTPAFHFDILKPYMEIYNKCGDILLGKIEELSKGEKSFDIYTLINLDALDIILRCAFSYESNCQTSKSVNEYTQAISEIQHMWSERTLRPLWYSEFLYSFTAHGKRFYKLCDIAHQVADDVIERRKKALEVDPNLVSNTKVKDFLDILITARDEDGKGLTSLEMRNEVDTFLFEGHDTTASGMTWTLYALAGHPDHQERVYEEIMSVMGDREEVLWDDLSKLEFTTMCIKEALRLHSAVPFIERRLSEDINIRGHVIPAGTRTAIHLFILHHNPHVWEEPNEFRPERFHPDKVRHMDPFQFIPFSAGSRNCIGQNFAMNEMKTTVVKVIRRFQLTLDPNHKVRREPTVTMKAENGVLLHAQLRK